LSKRLKPTKGAKRPKKVIFYLDRNLCAERIFAPLREAGYDLLTYTEEFGRVNNQQIPDPHIIAMCGERKHILITADRKMEFTYAPEIRSARVGIVLLLTNNDGADSWRERLITAQAAIREQIAMRKKPYLIRVATDGTLTIVKLYRKNKDEVLHLY
jgi:hypothetical protein